MKSIIIAAGAAKRLAPLANSIPKCLIDIGNKPTIEYQLDALNRYEVNEVVIVVGYLKEKIIQKYGYHYRNLSISYIDNPDFSFTNTVYSLWLAREYFRNEDFLYW